MRFLTIASLLAAAAPSLCCDDCYGPHNMAAHVRNVRRMQPGAPNATSGPRAPLEWGQINFMHTTDTHGWLEGHLKEQNYGADWGDFVTFSRHMQHKAGNLGVDLLLVDTGDLHDGNGLADAVKPDGLRSDPIFREIQYDILTIGNHELYLADVSYQTLNVIAKYYGDKYITSNVQLINPASGKFEYIGKQYRYFTTQHGLRIMAFGVLYDFAGNSNASKITPAASMVKETWFQNAVNFDKPIDLFVVLGHNPARPTAGGSTFGAVISAIRALKPDIPIQLFGGHNHIRDFAVVDQGTTALGSGRYCETLGWVAMSGIKSSTFKGNMKPRGVPNPTQKAIKVTNATGTASAPISTGTGSSSFKDLVYGRRYMDWNRLTFAYHAVGSQSETFDYHSGLRVSAEITKTRKELNLTTLYGCAPASYCLSCKPFGTPGNILNLAETALSAVIINQQRATTARYVIINSGSLRFDLVEGPFTFDDGFIVSPFNDTFQYIPNVPYNIASQVLQSLNNIPDTKRRRGLVTRDFGFNPMLGDDCVEAVASSMEAHPGLKGRSTSPLLGNHRRQTTKITPGYVTRDDFGTDGDDTVHSKIPSFPQPQYVQGNGSFPTTGTPASVDIVFLDFIESDVLGVLKALGASYTKTDVQYYLDTQLYSTNTYLPMYAKLAWQANVPNCPIAGN